MATKKEPENKRPKDFIQFILDAEKSPALTQEFLKIPDGVALDAWFKKKKYVNIQLVDCGDIIRTRDGWVEADRLYHGKGPCEDKNRGY
jgi:hypothetical protein